MPIPEANRELPASNSMVDAFMNPGLVHFNIGKSVESLQKAPIEKVKLATSDFFNAGVAYLANRGHDAYIQEVGTVTWSTIKQNRAQLAITDNMRKTVMELGVPFDKAVTSVTNNDVPHVLFGNRKRETNIEETAIVLLPFEFIVQVQTTPIDALGNMAWISSQVRDLANGRRSIDQEYFNPRANATKAHFLREAVKRHPDAPISKDSLNILAFYPDGIHSASLPKTALYKGISEL